jgi:hypothetical protein
MCLHMKSSASKFIICASGMHGYAKVTRESILVATCPTYVQLELFVLFAQFVVVGYK